MKSNLLKFIMTLCSVFTISNANEPTLKPVPFESIKEQIKGKPTMLEFGAESCHSCVVMGKVLYKIKNNYKENNVYFINVYNDTNIAMKYKVRMIPTQVFLDKNGDIIDKHIGMIKEEKLVEKLKKFNIIKG